MMNLRKCTDSKEKALSAYPAAEVKWPSPFFAQFLSFLVSLCHRNSKTCNSPPPPRLPRILLPIVIQARHPTGEGGQVCVNSLVCGSHKNALLPAQRCRMSMDPALPGRKKMDPAAPHKFCPARCFLRPVCEPLLSHLPSLSQRTAAHSKSPPNPWHARVIQSNSQNGHRGGFLNRFCGGVRIFSPQNISSNEAKSKEMPGENDAFGMPHPWIA